MGRMTWEEAVVWLRSQPEYRELVSQCYYDDPPEKSAERYYQSEEWSAVRSVLGNRMHGRVLDVGAGRGISSFAFAREGCQVTALEPDRSTVVGTGAIQQIVDKHPKLKIEICTEFAERLPFPDDSFDIVYGRAVMHHARDLAGFCSECARVLKKGGVFLGTREHVVESAADRDIFLANHPLHRHYGGENAFPRQEYHNALTAAGLRIARSFGPFETPINYAPLTGRQMDVILVDRIVSMYKIPSFLVSLLLRIRVVHRYASHMLSEMDTTPGRHYSFLAVKS